MLLGAELSANAEDKVKAVSIANLHQGLGRFSSVVEYLPSKHKALGSILSSGGLGGGKKTCTSSSGLVTSVTQAHLRRGVIWGACTTLALAGYCDSVNKDYRCV